MCCEGGGAGGGGTSVTRPVVHPSPRPLSSCCSLLRLRPCSPSPAGHSTGIRAPDASLFALPCRTPFWHPSA